MEGHRGPLKAKSSKHPQTLALDSVNMSCRKQQPGPALTWKRGGILRKTAPQ